MPRAGAAVGDAVLCGPVLACGHVLQGSSHTRWEPLPFQKRGLGAPSPCSLGKSECHPSEGVEEKYLR